MATNALCAYFPFLTLKQKCAEKRYPDATKDERNGTLPFWKEKKKNSMVWLIRFQIINAIGVKPVLQRTYLHSLTIQLL